MAAVRRGQLPLAVRLPSSALPLAALPDLPPISALFLIDFDVKAGYTVAWKQVAVPGLELEGAVEYKSLPSGLHTVEEDLVYFVHDDGHAGLSAFINAPTDDEAARHARMIAVGVLVPLSLGRLGRAWRHAEALKDMASKLVEDKKRIPLLEAYWEKHRARDATGHQPLKESPPTSPAISIQPSRLAAAGPGHTRNRSASDGAALVAPGHRLSPFHPAWSLTRLLDTFGPLIFPIHRAALLRKRILISTHAPVHEACNFVYDISILANIPLSVSDLLDTSASAARLRPLFNIGVHDIPFLMEDLAASGRAAGVEYGNEDAAVADEPGNGWIACTTDSILAMKEDLWDVLITMPPSYSVNAREKVWPTVTYAKKVPMKATQRDYRRFRSLRAGLRRLEAAALTPATEAPITPGGRASTSSGPAADDDPILADAAEKIVEPMTWAALAYHGFMWWASAGEQRRSDEADEAAHDAALLADLAPPTPQCPSMSRSGTGGGADLTASLASLTPATMGGGGGDEDDVTEDAARIELTIITYFHRLTTQMLSVLADIVESGSDDDEYEDYFEDEDEEDGDYADDDAEFTAASSSDDAAGSGRATDEEVAARRRFFSRNNRSNSSNKQQQQQQHHHHRSSTGGMRLLSSTPSSSQQHPLLPIRQQQRQRRAGIGAGAGAERQRMPGVHVDSDSLARMGLDVWSHNDADFVRLLTEQYFARRALVEGKGFEVCGLRVC